ncbi:recombinase family protein [Arthrobacter sp. ov118]|uniref:recombinase family protein n=1 Tax=Arthrobacter sp. ov118 TaxID=1761747 RepID=UPI00210CA6C7|nr:recombinase family protein [Arthrobacter sp. ov118]
MGTIGYVRVSTAGPSAELQTRALREAGCDRIFTDHGVSGTRGPVGPSSTRCWTTCVKVTS